MSESYNLLAVETATSACSVALSKAGTVFHRDEVGNNIHSKSVLSMVQAVLQDAGLNASELSAVVVGQGPGSFTGLRIGIGVAQGIAYGVACPMIGISSLDALALQSLEHTEDPQSDRCVIATIDARMGEVYWAEYLATHGQVTRVGDLRLDKPELISASDVPELAGRPILCGNAFAEYSQQFSAELMLQATLAKSVIFPSAVYLLELAKTKFEAQEWVAAVDFVPEYVRNDVAKKSTKKPF